MAKFSEIWGNTRKQIKGFQCKIDDAEVLYSYAVNAKDLIVEIGSFIGKSASILAQSKPANCQLVCIDPWDDTKYSGRGRKLLAGRKAIDVFHENMASMGLSPETIKSKSVDAVSNFQDNSIDLLYIDGCHTRRGVSQDIELYYPKVKDGGIILFHDVNQPSVVDGIINSISFAQISNCMGVHEKGATIIIFTEGWNDEVSMSRLLSGLDKYNANDVVLVITYPSDDDTQSVADRFCNKHTNWRHLPQSRILTLSLAGNLAIDFALSRMDFKHLIHLDCDVEVLHGGWAKILHDNIQDSCRAEPNLLVTTDDGVVFPRHGHAACMYNGDLFKKHNLRYDGGIVRSQDAILNYQSKTVTGKSVHVVNRAVLKHYRSGNYKSLHWYDRYLIRLKDANHIKQTYGLKDDGYNQIYNNVCKRAMLNKREGAKGFFTSGISEICPKFTLENATPIAVIVVSWNRLELLTRTIRSFKDCCEYPNYKIIAIDQNSDDGSLEYLRENTDKVIALPENIGWVKAKNILLEETLSKYDYLFYLENDWEVSLTGDWLSLGVKLLSNYDDIHSVRYFYKENKFRYVKYIDEIRKVGSTLVYVSGINLPGFQFVNPPNLTTSESYKKVGFYNEGLPAKTTPQKVRHSCSEKDYSNRWNNHFRWCQFIKTHYHIG
jgi:glycosyltransferase involved in cell wall biosynthesis